MKIVNIFIASSIEEFEKERIFIGNHVLRLNEGSAGKGYMVRLLLCEDEYENSQSIYDRQIQRSDIFITIIGKKLGRFTKHEILDVADKCNTIKKKIVIYSADSFDRSIHTELDSSFLEFYFFENLTENLTQLIDNLIPSVLDDIEDAFVESFPVNNIFLDIPLQNSIECAVIGNIIRRLRDQGNGIVIINNNPKKINAFVVLLDNEIKKEFDRITCALNEGYTSDLFWVFANQDIFDKSDIVTKKQIDKIEHSLGDKYFECYQTYKVLSIIFQNRLLSALIQNNMLDGSGFIYTVCDHWLVRKGGTFGHNFINLLNTGLDSNSEEQARKERVIKNLLNHYWLNGKTDKHIRALDAIQRAKYDYFVYNEEELIQIELNRSDYKQAILDYVYDNLEQLQLGLLRFSGQEMLLRIQNIFKLQQVEGIILSSEDEFKINFLAANILYYYNSQILSTYDFYTAAWTGFSKINQPSLKIIECAKQCCINLCQISFEMCIDKDTIKWIDCSEQYFTGSDWWFNAVILMYKRLLLRNENKSKETDCVKKLERIFQSDFVNQNNENLKLFLEYRYWSIWNDFPSIYKYKSEINYLIDNIYVPYFGHNNQYLQIGLKLFSLYALAEKDENFSDENLDICSEIIQQYKDNRDYNDRSTDFYNLLFVKATVLKKLGKTPQSIELFSSLSDLYRGKRDKACCFQSIALCYMDDYLNVKALYEAETYYLKALCYFQELNDLYCTGNVYDGLSFCYILLGKYAEAQTIAEKTLDNKEYDCPNKHSNYISSLLFQGLYEDALNYFNAQTKKHEILEQLVRDYDNEYDKLGIRNKHISAFLTEQHIK